MSTIESEIVYMFTMETRTGEPRSLAYLLELHDPDTVIFIHDGILEIGPDMHHDKKTIDTFRECILSGCIDPYHKERVFVMSESGKVYVTEDRGRSWKELYVPKIQGEYRKAVSRVYTDPIDKKLLWICVNIRYDNRTFSRQIIDTSEDGGKSFRRICPPINYQGAIPISEKYKFYFLVSPNESILKSNYIYYIHKGEYLRELSGNSDVMESEDKTLLVDRLFYTADSGKTTRSFNELTDPFVGDGYRGPFVENVFIFPPNVFVFTSWGGRTTDGPLDSQR